METTSGTRLPLKMKKLFRSPGVWENGITLVRLLTGWMILRYGLELFHIEKLHDFLSDEKFPFPVFSGYAAKIIEFVGGFSSSWDFSQGGSLCSS